MKMTFWDAAMATVMGMIGYSTLKSVYVHPLIIDDEPSSRYYPEWWPHVWADRNKSGGIRGHEKVAIRETLDGYSATLTTPAGDVRVEFTYKAYSSPYHSAQWWAEKGPPKILSLCEEEMIHFVEKEAPYMGNGELAAIANS